MKEVEIPDHNIFMMCERINQHALTELSPGYYFRNCRPDELELWKAFPFDSDTVPVEYEDFMNQIIKDSYSGNMDTFSRTRFLSAPKMEHPLQPVRIGKPTERSIPSIGSRHAKPMKEKVLGEPYFLQS